MSSQNYIPILVSLSDSIESDDARLVYKKNRKALLVVSSSSGNENCPIQDEEPAQVRTVVKEVESRLRSNVID